MEILNLTAGTFINAQVQKGVGSIILYSTKPFNEMEDEEISIQIERSAGNNIEVTEGFVNLKVLILANLYGDEAITSFPLGLGNFQTVAVIRLAKDGNVDLESNDRLKISLRACDNGENYVIDGHEEPNNSTEVYMYQQKNIPADQANYDINTVNFDTVVINQSASVSELNYTHENGAVTKHTERELRAMSQNVDNVCYIHQNGSVQSSMPDFLQLPLISIKSINIRKTVGTGLTFFMREDVDLKRLNLIKK